MLNAVDRPWGRYFIIYADKTQWLKRLIIYPGQSLSLQFHEERTEFWLTEDEGITAYIESDNLEEFSILPGEVYVVPVRDKHRLRNTTDRDVIVHEWAVGRVDESDITRLADEYGRS